ncbi:DUF6285 domain-containing protein, partial [Variovorax paradoxus]|uniref:DUF6285 domain-containing protein n=1 Tax=Variovorax paradoxus TaxID=34073 RepID=UPI002479E195
MSDSVPPAPTLLAATARYLEDELMPSLEGYHRFQTRIAINVLRIVERELRLGAAHDAAARERLLALLQDAPTPTSPSLALADALHAPHQRAEDALGLEPGDHLADAHVRAHAEG